MTFKLDLLNRARRKAFPEVALYLECLLLVGICIPELHAAQPNQFVDVSAAAGVSFVHASDLSILDKVSVLTATDADLNRVEKMDVRAEITTLWHDGGVAAGDYNNDGWPDLFAIGGDAGVARLFENNGDGTFIDKASVAGVLIENEYRSGAMFADYDGDGDLDLFVGGLLETAPKLYRNNGPNQQDETTFTEVFASVFPGYDVELTPNNWGGSFSDFDRDGDLDVFFTHSMTPFGPKAIATPGDSTQHLWRNDGSVFTDISIISGISQIYNKSSGVYSKDQSFSPNFADINEDGWPDLLVASDTGGSLVLINQQNGTFQNITISNQFLIAGMGAAVGDVNNDSHLDWFISQIRIGSDGNRLYMGSGNGTFTDVVSETDPFPAIGVESGYWGWAACMADLDNDQHLDIVHVNGFYWDGNPFVENGLFTNTPAVVFISNGDGTFTEQAETIGLIDYGEGRGISCVDYDRDGDIDIAISNHMGPFKLFENTLSTGDGFVTVKLNSVLKNPNGISSRLYLRSLNELDSGPARLMRQISVDGNFASSNLTEAHFGVGDWTGPFEVEVHWPNGESSVHSPISQNSFVTLEYVDDTVHKDGFE